MRHRGTERDRDLSFHNLLPKYPQGPKLSLAEVRMWRLNLGLLYECQGSNQLLGCALAGKWNKVSFGI